MKKKRFGGNMVGTTIFMGTLALALILVAYFRGHLHIVGLKSSGKLLLNTLPLICFAIVVAGLIQVLVPKEIIAKWLGKEAGLKGILIGCAVGGVTPGAPYVVFPIIGSFYRAGASIGTIVGFVSAWSLWQVSRLPYEIGLIGLRPTIARFVSTLIFPPIAGIIAQTLFSKFIVT